MLSHHQFPAVRTKNRCSCRQYLQGLQAPGTPHNGVCCDRSDGSSCAYLGLAARLGDALAVFGVVGPHAMHLVGCCLGGGISLALLCDDVYQHRAHGLCGLHLCIPSKKVSPSSLFLPDHSVSLLHAVTDSTAVTHSFCFIHDLLYSSQSLIQ